MYTLTLPLGSIRIVAAAEPPWPPGLRLDVQGQADAEQAALGAGRFLVLAELLVADQLGRLFQALLRADPVVDQGHRVGVGQLGAGEHVAAAELQRVDAQLVRDDVDHLLPAGGLHHPRPPVRALPARVGVGRLPGVGHRPGPGPVIRAGEDQRRQARHLAVAPGGEGPHVLGVVGLGRQQHTVLVGGRGDPQRLLAGMPGAGQVLGPVLDPLDRPVTEDHGRRHDGLLVPGGERPSARTTRPRRP